MGRNQNGRSDQQEEGRHKCKSSNMKRRAKEIAGIDHDKEGETHGRRDEYGKGFFENPVEREDEWLTTSEAADDVLRVSENALRIKVHRAQITAHRLGGRLRFRHSDLLKAINKLRR